MSFPLTFIYDMIFHEQKMPMSSHRLTRRTFLAAAGAAAATPLRAGQKRTVYVVPNFHPASCGWLTTFAKERVYCANTYFAHLDRVRDDPQYKFVLSEVNNMMAMLQFHPERREELRKAIAAGRVELTNGNFLESAISLSGGEALVRLGIEGLRWQKARFGVRPRFSWNIDVCGTPDQMPQITAGLGLEALVYHRMNPTGCPVHWMESPDGTRTLAFAPHDGYATFDALFRYETKLDEKGLGELDAYIADCYKSPCLGSAPILVLGGWGDYSRPPRYKPNPSEFLEQWRAFRPDIEVRIATASEYLDAILPDIRSGRRTIPTLRGGTGYTFDAFWIECPRVKEWFRRNEHGLFAAEALATAASLTKDFAYPVQHLHKTWLLMFLSMDRNTLWGSAGGMVFENEHSWDVSDRLTTAGERIRSIHESAGRALAGRGAQLALFNPLTWKRSDPFVLPAECPAPAGAAAQKLPGGATLCSLELQAFAARTFDRASGTPAQAIEGSLPGTIETEFYQARIDSATGALTSLKLKPSGREMLAGPANVLQFEQAPKLEGGGPGDFMNPRAGRIMAATSSQSPVEIRTEEGPLAIVVTVSGKTTLSGACCRRITFYRKHPRIDFETELNGIANLTVVTTEFPLSSSIEEVRRGIPYGFSHGAWDKPNPNLHGWTKDITPAVRFSHYALAGGGGLAILDRGLSGRELVGRSPILFLYNATDKYYGYPNPWLDGKGRHVVEYAIVAHEGPWREARIPQQAWEYNAPPVAIESVSAAAARTFLETSPNIIVESFRREGADIELRFVECLGEAGAAEFTLALPHKKAFLTDMTGAKPQPLAGGPKYRVPVRPQQIVTVRLRTASPVEEIVPVDEWDDLAPEHKRASLREYSNEIGHPPRGK